ncbi:unnamed protein product [Tetraodon nigroviridis]|uniref:(spotted green pufferfish) hypothetical protein n=1 Tax=Tetraodon nigroviridis TaxID=99883 RepID=Q4TAJ6_TETNG|nr:unnamed protein product [Tetraodon nigroviridis]
MAGRGRGRKMITFNTETVGVPRGESVPVGVHQPTPLFPVMEQKPLPLLAGEELDYLLALKQEFRGAMKTLPCFIQPASTHRDVERYSDKYHSSENTDTSAHWSTDWKRLPKELRTSLKRRPRDSVQAPSPQKKKKKQVKEKEEVLLKLETLEKKEEERGNSGGEEQEEEEETEEKKQENQEADGEEEYDEEEFEEETDYIMSYFDNGEEFGGDSDDNMDEAVY